MAFRKSELPLTSLYVLGHIYPEKTGGMEIFNYFFLKHRVENTAEKICYLSSCSIADQRAFYLPMSRKKPIRLFYSFQLFSVIFRLRKKVNYVYLSYAPISWIIPFVIALACGIAGLPYVVTIHSGESPLRRFMFPYRFFFRNAHAVIGVSEPVCTQYSQYFRIKKMLFVPPLIPFHYPGEKKDTIRIKLGFGKNDRIFLFVGALTGIKNPGTVIHAFKQLGHQFLESRNVKLVFVGNGELMEALKNEVVENQLQQSVLFQGAVAREKMPLYYGAADYYITASDYEGTSIALLEAMFHHLPIIAADSPGLNRMIRHKVNGLLFKPKDEKALAAAITRLIIDPVLAGALGEQAYLDYKKEYSYTSMMAEYDKLFEAVKISKQS